MRISLFFITIIVFFSCENRLVVPRDQLQYIAEKDFGVPKTLMGEKVILDSVPMGSISALKIDSLLLFQFDWRVVDHHIMLYNLYTGEYIQRLLPIGRGFKESTFFLHYNQVERDGVSSKIWVETDTKFGLLNLSKSIKEKEAIFEKQYDLERKLDLFHKFMKDDSVLVGKVYKSKEVPYYIRYKINKGEIIDTIPVFSQQNRLVDEHIFASYDHIKPDRSKLAMAMKCFNIINIVSLDGKKCVSLAIGEALLNYDQVWKRQSSKEIARVYYSGLCVSDDYIFCLYKGCLEIDKKMQVNTQVIVLNWEGKPCFRLNLIEKIFNISFDPKEKCLYGMSRHGEEAVFRYDLRHIIK